jgi:hypothetical protein
MIGYTDEIHNARADCLMFFILIECGWGRTRRLPSGAVVAEGAPVSGLRRLGYPQRHRLGMASKRVRQTCPEEAARYKQARKEWKEARRRLLAAQTEESWKHYVSGEGNRNSIAYRSKVDLSHQGGWLHFRTRRGFKYMAHELLPRPQERKRAREEMKEAEAILNEMRERIFEKMGVPPKFRRLA